MPEIRFKLSGAIYDLVESFQKKLPKTSKWECQWAWTGSHGGQTATALTLHQMKATQGDNFMDIFERNFFTSDIKVYAGIF